MLKTNSKAAKQNIRDYVVKNYTPDGYGLPESKDFQEISRSIWECFQAEKVFYNKKRNLPLFDLFEDWLSGLPGVLDTLYYYNRSAVDDLGDILEETEEERNRFSESEAEKMLSRLIFREVRAAL